MEVVDAVIVGVRVGGFRDPPPREDVGDLAHAVHGDPCRRAVVEEGRRRRLDGEVAPIGRPRERAG